MLRYTVFFIIANALGKFSYSWTVVSKDCPSFVSVFFFVRFCWIFCCSCTFSFVMILSGKLLLFAIDFIVFHHICCLSVVNGKDCILVIWYRYAASLCSLGWLDTKLKAVFVVVGFLCISISKLEGFLIIKISRKLMRPLFRVLGLIVDLCVFCLCIRGWCHSLCILYRIWVEYHLHIVCSILCFLYRVVILCVCFLRVVEIFLLLCQI